MVPKIPLERGDGRPPEALLPQLADEKARKEAEINHMIQESMMKHRAWNNDWVDNTWRPITPPLESANQSFRTAVAEFLPTPPASVSDEVEGFGLDAMALDKRADQQDKLGNGNVPIRYASPPMEETRAPRPSYRKRYGRGGRLFVDRRGLKRPLLSPTDDEDDGAMDERMKERLEYDLESDDEPQVYISDPHDYWNTKFRIHFSGAGAAVRDPTLQQKMIEEAQRRQAAAASANAAINREAAQGARAQLPPTAQMQR
jgi:enhancer of polycomb-like protein